ncbi:MAG: DUF4272 domain-containing protein [Thermodesulfobacteriota bacterium]
MTPIQRKARTIAMLKKRGIRYLSWLPCVESEEETELRTPKEVGIRMFCLFCVIGTAYDPSDTSYKRYLKKCRLWKHLTPDELAFLSNPSPDRRTCVNFTWRVEALFVLMWAVNLFRSLPFPSKQVKNERIIDKFPSFKKSAWPFIRAMKMRPKSQILDKSDLIYRLHWATRQAEIDGEPPPPGVDPEVILEWRHAINWLTKYDDSDGDHVSTDT